MVIGDYTTVVQARVGLLTAIIVTPPRKNKIGRSEWRTIEQSVGGGRGSPPTAALLVASAGSGLFVSLPPSLPFSSLYLRLSFPVLGVVTVDPGLRGFGLAKPPEWRRN